jgi:hypothetical protein
MNFEQSITDLENFITDFYLKDYKGVVSFDGMIHFYIEGRLKIFESNVQIITSNHLDTVYIVCNMDNVENMPDMFDPGHFSFTYVKRECLRIRPVDANSKMVVSIFPRTI